jgi:hypothetical protein
MFYLWHYLGRSVFGMIIVSFVSNRKIHGLCTAVYIYWNAPWPLLVNSSIKACCRAGSMSACQRFWGQWSVSQDGCYISLWASHCLLWNRHGGLSDTLSTGTDGAQKLLLRFRHSFDANRASRARHQCMITNPASCLVRVGFQIRSEEQISRQQYFLLLFSLSRKMPVIQDVPHMLCKRQYVIILVVSS